MEKMDAVSVLAEFRRKHARARMEFTEWEAARDDIQAFQNEVAKWTADNAEIRKLIAASLKEDAPYVKRIVAMQNRMESLTGDAVRRKIRTMFYSVFDNLRSQSLEICEIPVNTYRKSEKVTIGPYGFGIRHNVVAKPLKDCGQQDFEAFYLNIATIIDALEAKEKVEKMRGLKDIAANLRAFIELVPAGGAVERGDTGMDIEPVAIPSADNDAPPVFSSRLRVTESGFVLDFDKKHRWSSEWTFYFRDKGMLEGEEDDSDEKMMHGKDALVYLQMRRNIPAFVEQYCQRGEALCAVAETMIGKVQDRFGMKLLLKEV